MMDDCFIHSYIFYYWMCRFDLSVISFFFFSNHSFWPCCYGFLTFLCLWEICFSGQMISGSVSWLLGFGSSSDRIIILAVECLSWRQLDSWSFAGRLF